MISTHFTELPQIDLQISALLAVRGRWSSGNGIGFHGSGRKCELLYYMISGERTYILPDGERFTLRRGDAIFIPTGICYDSFVSSREQSIGIYVDFRLSSYGERVYINEPFRIFNGIREQRFQDIVDATGNRLIMNSLLYELLAELSELAVMQGFGAVDRTIRAVIIEIGRHPERGLDVAGLARECCMSVTGFRERFKRQSGGLSPTEYRSRLRLKRAKEMIASGGLTVAQIAEQLGFWDTAHLYRQLREDRTPESEE